MTLEEVDKIINELTIQVPNLQVQLNQAIGYRQALLDMAELKGKKEPKPTN